MRNFTNGHTPRLSALNHSRAARFAAVASAALICSYGASNGNALSDVVLKPQRCDSPASTSWWPSSSPTIRGRQREGASERKHAREYMDDFEANQGGRGDPSPPDQRRVVHDGKEESADPNVSAYIRTRSRGETSVVHDSSSVI